MIIRGPEPEKDFQQLPNDTARDKRLSFRARGLLALMLSYPADWEFNREWLAEQSDGEGVAAVRTALKELETHGYLVRRRTIVEGRFHWQQIIYRWPQSNVVTTETIGRDSTDEKSADEIQPSPEHGYEHEVRGGEGSQSSPPNQVEEAPALTFNRGDDRALFRSLLGGYLRSNGDVWVEEERWHPDAFYDAFRARKGRAPIKAPGRWLRSIVDRGELEEWLEREGLEIVPDDTATQEDTSRLCGCGMRLAAVDSVRAGECVRCRGRRRTVA